MATEEHHPTPERSTDNDVSDDTDNGGEVESSYEPDTGSDERDQAGNLHGSEPRPNTPARTEPGSGLDRLHGRSVERRSDGPARSSDGLGEPIEDPLPGFEFTRVRVAPLPLASELGDYEQVLNGAADRIIGMAERAAEARHEANLIPVKAEARALTIATAGVAFFPWVAFGLGAALAIAGESTAALVSALAGALSLGPQIISATRRPQVVQPRSEPQAPRKKKRKKK